jgi:hypothetical protein
MTAPLSTIAASQNDPANLRLLKARQALWAIAVDWQIAQFILVVLVPLIGAIVGAFVPDFKAGVGAGAVSITILDVVLLDRGYRRAIRTAAQASEQFDVAVLKLPWNGLSAGEPLPPEEIKGAADRWDRNHSEEELRDWYPTSVARAPQHIARIICQRSNVTYDTALRRDYSKVLVWAVAAISVGIIVLGFVNSATLADLVLSGLVPVAPLVIWATREYFRQQDAANANAIIRRESEALLKRVIVGQCDEPTCTSQAVQLQAAQFARRSTNPLIMPRLYNYRRKPLEERMAEGADHWLREAGY